MSYLVVLSTASDLTLYHAGPPQRLREIATAAKPADLQRLARRLGRPLTVVLVGSLAVRLGRPLLQSFDCVHIPATWLRTAQVIPPHRRAAAALGLARTHHRAPIRTYYADTPALYPF